jgi:D-alanine-D-alanine ligase
MVSKLRVAVLMGGRSNEREISLRSGSMVARHLDRDKYDVLAFDTATIHRLDHGQAPGELPAAATEADFTALAPLAPRAIRPDSREPSVDVAFIALHGRGGEDGAIQGLLELLGIPYTGSGVLASALAMDKAVSKRIFKAEGIPTAPWRDFWMDNCVDVRTMAAEIQETLGLPVVVKPACEGSTIGITIARTAGELPAALEHAAAYGPHVLAEQFVPGTEITAAILGNRNAQVLPLVEIVPAGGFYDYHAKYTPGATEEVVPARIADDVAARARDMALTAFEALGCRGVARVDMITGPAGPVVLEVNTVPGMTETSLVPRAAEAAGMSFARLLDRIIELALEGR